MVTISNRIELIDSQIAAILAQMEILNAEHSALQLQKLEPVPWHENTDKRIVISSDDAVKLMINAKSLIDYLFNSDITAIKEGENTFVYVNWIEPEHEQILIENGAEIETNESTIL